MRPTVHVRYDQNWPVQHHVRAGLSPPKPHRGRGREHRRRCVKPQESLERDPKEPLSLANTETPCQDSKVSRFESEGTFEMNGAGYKHAGRRPDFTGQTVRRFTYGEEPQGIAQVPLVNGATLEIHGYATHWTHDDDVAWTDDRGSQYTCWVPAHQVRRPAAVQWHGSYLPRCTSR